MERTDIQDKLSLSAYVLLELMYRHIVFDIEFRQKKGTDRLPFFMEF